MITTYLLNENNEVIQGEHSQIAQWQDAENAFIWIDIEYSIDEKHSITPLLEQFGCHNLAIKDVLRDRHPPKVELFKNQLFIMYRGIREVTNSLEFAHQEIGFFIGKDYLITLHPAKSLGIESFLNAENIAKFITNPCKLACKIMHHSTSTYLNEVLKFEAVLEQIESTIIDGDNDDQLKQLTLYKSRLVKLNRTFNYHLRLTESLKRLESEDEIEIVSASVHNITDLHERFDRLYSLSKMYYEISGDLIDGYLSMASHKLNNTMRVLTVITAIFVPLSFLAGLYGMNFDYMPELKFKYAYFTLVGVMSITAIGLISWFKHKKWF